MSENNAEQYPEGLTMDAAASFKMEDVRLNEAQISRQESTMIPMFQNFIPSIRKKGRHTQLMILKLCSATHLV